MVFAVSGVSRRKLLLAAAAAIAGTRLSSSRAQAAVRIGFDNPFAPFGSVIDGEPRGMLIELVAAVLKNAGQSFVYVPLLLEESEKALSEGRVDALAWKGVSPEREKAMSFSAPLVMTGGAAFTRPGLAPSANLKDFAGLTVVTPRSGPLYAQIARDYPEVKLRDGVSYEASFEAVLAGQADVAALNFQVGLQMANKRYHGRIGLPAAPYVPVPLAFAVKKGGSAADLLRAFELGLAQARADGSAARTIDKWLHD